MVTKPRDRVRRVGPRSVAVGQDDTDTLEAVYRLRYTVYETEQGRGLPFAEHAAQRLTDILDLPGSESTILAARCVTRIASASRSSSGARDRGRPATLALRPEPRTGGRGPGGWGCGGAGRSRPLGRPGRLLRAARLPHAWSGPGPTCGD